MSLLFRVSPHLHIMVGVLLDQRLVSISFGNTDLTVSASISFTIFRFDMAL